MPRDLCWNGNARHRVKTASRSRRIPSLAGAQGRHRRSGPTPEESQRTACQVAVGDPEGPRLRTGGKLDINLVIRRGRRRLAARARARS